MIQLYLFGLGFGIASAFTWWAFSIPVVINITIAEKDANSAIRSISDAATKVKNAIRSISSVAATEVKSAIRATREDFQRLARP